MNESMELILFDDQVARSWEPFALTRPAGELLFGALTLRARAEMAFHARCAGHLTAEHLEGFTEPGAAPVLPHPPGEGASKSERLFLLSRFVPDWGIDFSAFAAQRSGPLLAPAGEVVGWFAAAEEPAPDAEFFLNPTSEREPVAHLPGTLLERVWELMTRNAAQIALDVAALHPEPDIAALPGGAFHWGGFPLVLGEGATVEPGSAFDTTGGPIWLDRDVTVRAFTRLAGPAYVGPGSVLLGGPIEAISAGPVCRLRGELADTVCLGYVNKQHDGHIGHAYLGRWVNLGAETTNSDLKNNYGSIRIRMPQGEVDTGEIKLGSLLGDHVKTGIGLLLNTGTVIGAGSSLYGAAMPAKFVPPFSWGTGEEVVEYRLEKFLEVAERAMQRRAVALSPAMREQLRRAWLRGRSQAEMR